MTIPRETIDSIRDTVSIVDVISEYLPNVRRSGKDFTALCPFHPEKSPSFFISPSKNIFHCFGCNAGGDVFKFIMQYENISYPEAIRKLALKTGITIKETDSELSDDKKILYDILNSAMLFYNKYLLESEKAAYARSYLEKRGINNETIEKFQIGYAPEGSELFNKASKKHNKDTLTKTGLVGVSERDNRPYDFLRNRITFPIFDLFGHTIAFGGRALSEDVMPPYLNTPDTVVYNKSKSLYGLFQSKQTINRSKKIIMLEGYMDVLMCHQKGIDCAVAPLGTSLTGDQIKILKRYTDTLTLVFDSDDSGREASIRAGDLCLENEMLCNIVSLPEKMDPDEYLLAYGKEKFDALTDSGINPVEFKTSVFKKKNDTSKPEVKTRLVRYLIDTIIKIKDPVYRHETIKFVSNMISIDENVIVDEIKKAFDKKKSKKEDIAKGKLPNFNIRTLDEEIVCLCIHNPEMIDKIPGSIFNDERCLKVFSQLHRLNQNESFAKIAESFEDDIAKWFIQLAFQTPKYESPADKLASLLKDVNLQVQEKRRKELEKEVIHMWDGKTQTDPDKIKEFQELTKILKGSYQR